MFLVVAGVVAAVVLEEAPVPAVKTADDASSGPGSRRGGAVDEPDPSASTSFVDGTPDAVLGVDDEPDGEWHHRRSRDAVRVRLSGKPSGPRDDPRAPRARINAAPAAIHPDDPLAPRQWALAAIRAPAAWAVATGAGVVVAVVDTGVDLGHPDLAHPDLAAKLLPGASFFGCPAPPESCGDGGWRSGPPRPGTAPSPHGTHMAGIIGAVTGNGIGVAGVAPDAALLPVKVLDETVMDPADVAAGIRWAVARGADVVNLSLGEIPGAELLAEAGVRSEIAAAAEDAVRRGAVVVAAAGNESYPLCESPAAGRGVVCVTAVDHRGLHPHYANPGVKAGLLAVAAPGGSGLARCGEDVVSTAPAGASRRGTQCALPEGYDERAGTSTATAHVAGVVALLLGQGRSPDDAVAALVATARNPVTRARGAWDPVYGYGVVDAAAAVAVPVGSAALPAGPGVPARAGGAGGGAGADRTTRARSAEARRDQSAFAATPSRGARRGRR